MQIKLIDKQVTTHSRFPSQAEIDAAYAVRIFLQHRPGQAVSLPVLIRQSGIPEQRLKAAFHYQFHEPLEEYFQATRHSICTYR